MNREPVFDTMSGDPEWREFTNEEREKIDGFLARFGLPLGARILEPGCGTGRLSQLLAAAVGPTGHLLACDSSPAMIKRARTRNLGPQVEFLCAPLLEIDRYGPWDAIICLNVLPHLQPLTNHLEVMRRSLHEDGALWICHSAGREFINAVHAHAGMPSHRLPQLNELRRRLESVGFRWNGGEDLKDRYWASATR